MEIDLSDDLALASRAVLAGGRAAMASYGAADLDVEDPTGRGPVTAADRASNEAILAILAAERPGEALRSEESADRYGASARGRLWVVDPLDGTREFIDGIGEFSVMVGLAVDGRAVLGAVYQPDPDRLFAGEVGRGARVTERVTEGGEARRLEAPREAAEPLRLVRSRSHPNERLRRLEEALGDVEVILSGSAGSKCALVALGRADLYVHPVPYLKEWDTCAPEALLVAAGGRVTDCFGEPLRYGKADPKQPRGILAGNPGAAALAGAAVAAAAEGLR